MNETKEIRLGYFAILREQAGCDGEVFETTAQTPSELYSELQAKNGFSIDQDALRVAINGDFSEFDVSLSKGDEVVFIPPVAGG